MRLLLWERTPQIFQSIVKGHTLAMEAKVSDKVN